MTSILGNKKVVIADADGLIALMHQDDALFEQAKATVNFLVSEDYRIIFPVTTIAEALTTIRRKLNNPALATYVTTQIEENLLLIEDVSKEVLTSAFSYFNPGSSKQHTFFDALIVAIAKTHQTQIVYSFDKWYISQGLTLANSLVR